MPELIYSVLNTCINATTVVYTCILFLTVCIIMPVVILVQ